MTARILFADIFEYMAIFAAIFTGGFLGYGVYEEKDATILPALGMFAIAPIFTLIAHVIVDRWGWFLLLDFIQLAAAAIAGCLLVGNTGPKWYRAAKRFTPPQ